MATSIAEAWRKRRYLAAFVSKLSDAETECAEVQTWLDFAIKCAYVDSGRAEKLDGEYEEIIRMIVAMINEREKWVIKTSEINGSR